jgi:alkylation response protein AidB-like acyl-CoA dehydrogenase
MPDFETSLLLLMALIGRIGIAAQMLGLAQGAFSASVPYTYQRSQFGQPIGTFQGMAFQIAEAAIQIESARLLTYNAARRKEEGKEFTKQAAMAKYWSSVVAQDVSGKAIEWAGGVGFTRETGIEKFWRDSKIVSASCSMRKIGFAHRLFFVGSHLRGDVQHPAADYCKIYPKRVLVA